MKYSELKINDKVNFTFAGWNYIGKIIDFRKEIKYNVDVSRYTIEDEDGFKYPVSLSNIIKKIK